MTRKCMQAWLRCSAVVAITLLTACTVHPPKQADVQDEISKALDQSVAINNGEDNEANKTVPRAVNSSLVPNLRLKRINVNTRRKRFDIAVNDMPINTYFQSLVKGTQYNVIVSPKVTGNVTINLKKVTIPEAIDATCQAYNLGYKQTEFGYQILPDALETQIFSVNYLDINRRGHSETSVTASQLSSDENNDDNNNGSSGGGSNNNSNSLASSLLGGGSSSSSSGTDPNHIPGRSNGLIAANNSTISTSQQSDFWTTLNHSLHTIIGKKEGRKVVVNPQAGLVIVRAYPNELREVAHYLDSTQNILDRQVILEAKVLEVTLNAGYESGINWNILGVRVDNTGLNNNLKDFSGIFSVTATAGDGFSTVMQLLSTQGRVQVLSSPRISTLNNQKAIIKVGGDQFFVTNIANTVTAGTIAGNNTQEIDLTPFFSGIALDVTPQIGPNGNVTLHIHPIVSRVEEDQRKFVVSGQAQDLPLAKTTVRESDSVVKSKDSQVIVIGGLMQDTNQNYVGTTPGVDKTIAKPAFSRYNLNATKTELVILLRARIVGPHTWNNAIIQARKGFDTAKPSYKFDVTMNKKLFPKPAPKPVPPPKPAPKPAVKHDVIYK